MMPATAAAGAVTLPRMPSAAETHGSLPNAKYAALLLPLRPGNGPTLEMPIASKSTYEFQQQMQLMDLWTTNVIEVITDYAQILDRHWDKAQGHQVHTNNSFEKLR